MIVRRVRFGEDPSAIVPGNNDVDNIDVKVQPSTALKGLGLWVTAGVLTHIAIRIVDRWFEKKGR